MAWAGNKERLMTVRPYRITARISNNRLWSAIRQTFPHITSQREAAEQLGTSPTTLCAILGLRYWPGCRRQKKCDGLNGCHDGWSATAWMIANIVCETPDYLFDASLYGRQANPIILELDKPFLIASGLLALPAWPEDIVFEGQRGTAINDTLDTLPPRTADVVRRRFGLPPYEDTQTLDAVGEAIGVTRERVRQIEAGALRKLRHATKRHKLLPFYE